MIGGGQGFWPSAASAAAMGLDEVGSGAFTLGVRRDGVVAYRPGWRRPDLLMPGQGRHVELPR